MTPHHALKLALAAETSARDFYARTARQASNDEVRALAAEVAAVDAIETSFELLEYSPFSCRKAWPGDRPWVRELVIPFGSAGYVALFEIDGPGHVTILAARYQREEDYH